ncbi:MAG: hypothetical protein ACLR2O_12925 [Coprococcus sp.]
MLCREKRIFSGTSTLPYTEENGYVAGSAYENGQIVESIGGGSVSGIYDAL